MKYYIIAGEASGDLHGSNLMKGIYAEDPDAQIRFWGGDCMQSVWKAKESGIYSVERSALATPISSGLVRHYKEGAVMGLIEVLSKVPKLIGNIRFCKKDIATWKPDVVILIR